MYTLYHDKITYTSNWLGCTIIRVGIFCLWFVFMLQINQMVCTYRIYQPSETPILDAILIGNNPFQTHSNDSAQSMGMTHI